MPEAPLTQNLTQKHEICVGTYSDMEFTCKISQSNVKSERALCEVIQYA